MIAAINNRAIVAERNLRQCHAMRGIYEPSLGCHFQRALKVANLLPDVSRFGHNRNWL